MCILLGEALLLTGGLERLFRGRGWGGKGCRGGGREPVLARGYLSLSAGAYSHLTGGSK